jgi:hypothetical protein
VVDELKLGKKHRPEGQRGCDTESNPIEHGHRWTGESRPNTRQLGNRTSSSGSGKEVRTTSVSNGPTEKLIPNIWTSAGALDQCLSGRNRRHPCRKLATLEPVKVREWIDPDHFTSFIKKCPFVIWRQGERDIDFSLPDPNPPGTRSAPEKSKRSFIRQ